MKNRIKSTLAINFILIYSCLAQNQNYQSSKILIDKYVNFWNTANFDKIDDILCKDFELIESPEFNSQIGIDAFKNTVKSYKIAYPDFHLEVNELIIDNDKIAGRWTITATNTGPGTFPPTGKTLKVIGMAILHIKDGKIKDEWIAGNDLYWLQQLGFKIINPK